jgi:hypothetical protein
VDTPNDDETSSEEEDRQQDKKKKKKRLKIEVEEDKENKYDRKETLNSSVIRTSSSLSKEEVA